MSRNLLVVGGFSEGKSVLEPLASEAANYEDFDRSYVKTYGWAMEYPEHLAKLSEDSLVITHSAGIVAVSGALADPNELAAFNGPEPTSDKELLSAIMKVTTSHFKQLGASAHRRALTSHLGEFLAHGRFNLAHKNEILTFSTTKYLKSMAIGERAVWMLSAVDDEFFPADVTHMVDALRSGVNVKIYLGNHHELLTNPHLVGMLYEDLDEEFDFVD